jgi:WD40 repeat protein
LKDKFGDPLPAGAVLRLGTVRLRNNDLVCTVAFAPEGKVLAAAGVSEPVRFWHAETGESLGELELTSGGSIAVRAITFSPDGKWLAVGGSSQFSVWDRKTGKRRWEQSGAKAGADGIVFSPDSKRLATAADGLLFIWDVASGEFVTAFPKETFDRGCNCPVACSADGKWLALAYLEAIVLGDWTETRIPKRIDNSNAGPWIEKKYTGICFSPGADYVIAAEFTPATNKQPSTSRLRYLNCGDRKVVRTVPLTQRVLSMTSSRDAKFLAIVHPAVVQIRELATGKLVRELPRPKNTTSRTLGVAFSPDGKRLAVASGSQAIHVWDLTTGKPIVKRIGHEGYVLDVDYSPDGCRIVTNDRDGIVCLWDATTGQQQHRLLASDEMMPQPETHAFAPRLSDFLMGMAFSPDSRFVVTTGWPEISKPFWNSRGILRVWDVHTGKPVFAGIFPTVVPAVAFSPDGKLLALYGPMKNGKGAEIIVCAAESRKELFRLSAVGIVLNGLRFSADSKKLLVAGGKNIRIWDVATQKLQKHVTIADGASIMSIALLPDEQKAIFNPGGQPGIHFLDLQTGKVSHRLTIPPRDEETVVYILGLSRDERVLVAGAAFYLGKSQWDDRLHLIEVTSGRTIQTLHTGKAHATSAAFAPYGKHFVTGMEDGTALIWDIGPIKPAKAPTAAVVQRWWNELASDDTESAYLALRHLAGSPEQSLPVLKKYLQAKSAVSAAEIQKFIDDLDSPKFAIRTKASQELAKLGSQPFPLLAAAMKKPLSLEQYQRMEKLFDAGPLIRHPKILQRLRAIQALEFIGSNDAKQILQALAKGHSTQPETAAGEKALQRLLQRAKMKSAT